MIASLVVIAIISFLVILHELGHYLAAKKANVIVEEFGLGYPPKLLTLFKVGETEFTLNLIPFGGFVRLVGESGPESEGDIEEQEATGLTRDRSSDPRQPGPFYTKTIKQRLTIILAGIFFNIIFAVAAFSVVFSFIGIPTPLENQARIGWVMPDSPAEQAQLPTEVNIIEIKTDKRSYRINSIQDVQQAVADNRGQELTLEVTHQCQQLSCPDETELYQVYARSEAETPSDQGSLGILFQESVLTFYPWWQMPFRGTIYGVKQALTLSVLIVRALTQVVTNLVKTGQVQQGVAGPVGIIHQAQQGNLIQEDFWSNLGFAGMLSLNLGIMNLLPIPALDGGRALFIIFERFFDRKRVQQIENYANYIGFGIIAILIIGITINDVIQVFAG